MYVYETIIYIILIIIYLSHRALFPSVVTCFILINNMPENFLLHFPEIVQLTM